MLYNIDVTFLWTLIIIAYDVTRAEDCWDASTGTILAAKSGQYCKTFWSNGTTLVVESNECDLSTNNNSISTKFSCCQSKPFEVCNRVERCVNMQRGSFAFCRLSDYGCATNLLSGEGMCIGELNTYESLVSQKDKYSVCIGKTACNAIEKCWNQRDLTRIDCQKQIHNGIVACQNIVNETGIYTSSCANSCTPTGAGIMPIVTCCYTSMCNKVVAITTTTPSTHLQTHIYDQHTPFVVGRSGFGKIGLGDSMIYSSSVVLSKASISMKILLTIYFLINFL